SRPPPSSGSNGQAAGDRPRSHRPMWHRAKWDDERPTLTPLRVLSATPPYRIETERLVIRCYEPDDAPLLKAAVDSSIEHLLPWMPWARFEPQSLEEKVELCRMFRGQFDLDTNYIYGIFSPDETEQLGGSGFHKRSNEGSLEIGYWVAAGATGRGIATEVTAVQTRAAIELCGLDRVDVQV